MDIWTAHGYLDGADDQWRYHDGANGIHTPACIHGRGASYLLIVESRVKEVAKSTERGTGIHKNSREFTRIHNDSQPMLGPGTELTEMSDIAERTSILHVVISCRSMISSETQ